MEISPVDKRKPRLPTLRGVNSLYLITMLLVVTLGTLFQGWDTGIGLMLTEIGLVWLPAFLYLLWAGLPADDTVRWRWPGNTIAALGVLCGLSFAFFVIWMGEAIVPVFGYTIWLPPDFYPQNLPQALILFTALVIAAPLCEEFLFRGVIQRGYEQLGARVAVIAVSVMFTAFHLSFQRMFLLLPIALILGYVAWRSASLVTSILVHMSYNLVASTIVIIGSFRPDLDFEVLLSWPVAGLGLLVSLFSVWAIGRVQTNENGSELAPRQNQEARAAFHLSDFWPLIVAVPIVVVLVLAELVVGLFPQALASEELALGPPPWNSASRWTYELRDAEEQLLGQAECQLEPGSEVYNLQCLVQNTADFIETGQEQPTHGGFQTSSLADWDDFSLLVAGMTGRHEEQKESPVLEITPYGADLRMEVFDAGTTIKSLEIPGDALVQGEWPWRLSALRFDETFSAQATLANPWYWSNDSQTHMPGSEPVVVVVQGGEPIATPAGNYLAWRVEVGEQTAWYDVEPPHTLLRYDDGQSIYLLTGVE